MAVVGAGNHTNAALPFVVARNILIVDIIRVEALRAVAAIKGGFNDIGSLFGDIGHSMKHKFDTCTPSRFRLLPS